MTRQPRDRLEDRLEEDRDHPRDDGRGEPDAPEYGCAEGSKQCRAAPRDPDEQPHYVFPESLLEDVVFQGRRPAPVPRKNVYRGNADQPEEIGWKRTREAARHGDEEIQPDSDDLAPLPVWLEQPAPQWRMPEDALPCEGAVKFFDAAKAYGFVIPFGGGEDVYVGGHTLARHGLAAEDLVPGHRLAGMMAVNRRGRMELVAIEFVEPDPAAKELYDRVTLKAARAGPVAEPEFARCGVVKTWDHARGFGFVRVQDLERDVFVHQSVLDAAGLAGVAIGQSVAVAFDSNDRGYMARKIEVLR